MAWALMAGAGCLLILVPVVYAASRSTAAAGTILGTALIAIVFSAAIRILAMGMRPSPVVLRMSDPAS